MNLLDWHRVFDGCTDLDAIHGRWQDAAQAHYLNPGHATPEYQDALLSFVATSTLPAPLKLGALLACVSGYDFDLRLAVGVLDDLDDDSAYTDWPAALADTAGLLGPCPALMEHDLARDPALAHFALGPLASLREALRWNGEDHAHWRAAFWQAYAGLACRWADSAALDLALARGVRLTDLVPAALDVLAEGVHSPARDAPWYTEGRSNAGYLALIDRLRAAGLDLHRESATVLTAAARADNAQMLEQLATRGADLALAGPQALAAAASNAAHDAVAWLLEHGVTDAAALDDALLAAVSTLDETLVEMLLDAGASLGSLQEQALCAACAARPFDLYNGETEFIVQRADMLVSLALRGAPLDHPRFIASLRCAAQGPRLLAALRGHPGLEARHRQALAAAGD
ncbi:hypothetical protein LK540_21180 [Massilia sp. IC2-278]|uniref:hypothetical protein n=1 Tax=Massilia sp. IC2-278 TaxID=2887200 RepID=UPI001E36AAB7|nr:hypothetical protein [Massilia sp. IC2-278]MCC2962951.1 hypothetical protein [Massilia sp. IC2-278]